MVAKKKKYGKRPRHSVDRLAKNLWLALLEDFRCSLGNDFAENAESAFRRGPKSFREYSFPDIGLVDPKRFKWWHQLKNLLKKYRFENDKYTDDELTEVTLNKFFTEQVRLSQQFRVTPLLHMVLQRARRHAKRILGRFDKEYVLSHSRFGKKSSIGCPLNLAYIDEKLTNAAAFTSSTECAKWFFKDLLPDDPLLKKLVQNLGVVENDKFVKTGPIPANLACDFLNLVLVPKSWKVHRPITPLTLLSLFYSYGVGEQITNCLKMEGLNISRLQQIHADLVKLISETLHLATADLSGASDSVIFILLNWLFPRDWLCAMRKTFTHQLYVDGKPHYTESVLPMGNGLTFPAETLVFYVLLKAIAELANVKGRISVYGDDLIYPSKLHRFVATIFPQLGLKLNLDKTFVKFPFRESCGTDYYRGIDVRPAILPESKQWLTTSQYVAYCYKVYNNIQRRWPCELHVQRTLHLLLQEIAAHTNAVYRVPPSFPDYAGIKVADPSVIPMDSHMVPWTPIRVRFYSGSIWYHFHYLTETPHKRIVKSVYPYYWLSLQGRDDLLEDKNFWETDYSVYNDAPRQSLNWETLKRVRYSRGKNGKRYRIVKKRFKARTPSRVASKLHVKSNKKESISDWL